jgi:hypothetical protein
VTRTRRVAQLALRFWVSEPVRLQARLTPLLSTRPLPLLPGTTLAGRRSAKTAALATATVSRAGTLLLRARVGAARLVRGRLYLVRLTAVDTAGGRRTLVLRVRA